MSGNTRASVLPIEHLDAELLAAPFASRTSFQYALVSLDDNIAGGAAALWRETEKDLLGRFPGMSIDELIIRRNRIWFGRPGNPSPRSLLDLLRDAAKSVF